MKTLRKRLSAVAFCGAAFFLLTAYTDPDPGKKIYRNNCARCHGFDGTAGRSGAKNLRQTTLSDAAMYNIIANGKGNMPAWKFSLKETELVAVRNYVKTLKDEHVLLPFDAPLRCFVGGIGSWPFLWLSGIC